MRGAARREGKGRTAQSRREYRQFAVRVPIAGKIFC
jgi:hypothetical protein